MPKSPIDDYLATVPEPQRATLTEVRTRIAKLLPEAEECISYGMPAFRVRGKVVAGFASFKNHCAYLPHSGQVLRRVAEVADFTQTQGSLHFPVDKPLSVKILKELIRVRMAQEFGA